MLRSIIGELRDNCNLTILRSSQILETDLRHASACRKTVFMTLAEIRKQQGLTIEHVAVLADVHKSTISRAERGLQTLRPETVVKLSKALKVSPRRITETG